MISTKFLFGVKSLLVVLFAYAVSSIVATLLLMNWPGILSLTGNRTGLNFEGFLGISWLVMIFAAPGFVLLRGSLFIFRIRNFMLFGLAGAVNGGGSQLLFLEGLTQEYVVAGLFAGLAVWGGEQLIKNGQIIRPFRVSVDG